MSTILQYYSTENNQLDNSNCFLVNFGGNSNFIFIAAKWEHSLETVKQPINLKLQLIHLTTELLGPLITDRLSFTNG